MENSESPRVNQSQEETKYVAHDKNYRDQQDRDTNRKDKENIVDRKDEKSSRSTTDKKDSSSRRKRSRSHHKRSRSRDHRRRHHRDSSRGRKNRYHDNKKYRHYRKKEDSSSSSSSSSSRSSSRSSSNRKNKRKDFKKQPKTPATTVHPYFQKKSLGGDDPAAPQKFWDGFQWIVRSQPVFDLNQNAVDSATKAVTGEDQKQNEERIAASKTVIIENIALDLGLTPKEIQKFLFDELEKLNEKGVEIIDIDMNNGPTSIAVELKEKQMVDKIKKLDGIHCLGESLRIRKLNEETAQTNMYSAAITLVALQNLIGSGDASLNLKAGSLKTVNVSSVIKISNVFDREEELTPEVYEELFEDMEDEFVKIPHLKRIKIIRNGEERLGAEVGSVFVEFRDKKSAEIALKKIKGRIYDGREIKACYVDDKLYYKELCLE